jgi:hypothetical protein
VIVRDSVEFEAQKETAAADRMKIKIIRILFTLSSSLRKL